MQGILGAAWWLVLLLLPQSRRLFLPEQFPESVLMSLVIADLTFVIGSIFVGWLILSSRNARTTSWFLLGATSYATLTCWGWTLFTGVAILGSITMSCATFGTVLAVPGEQR